MQRLETKLEFHFHFSLYLPPTLLDITNGSQTQNYKIHCLLHQEYFYISEVYKKGVCNS